MTMGINPTPTVGGFHPNTMGANTVTVSPHRQDQVQEFYCVQKCWFDGPHMEPPVDYRGLFCRAEDAERIAYQSAYAYARWKRSVVRTILLSNNTHKDKCASSSSSYAFSAGGKLFWVRRLYATFVVDGLTAGSHHQFNDVSNLKAHAILTNGVIGGTGNANSRRGNQVDEGRVFVGSSAASQAWALQAAHTLPPNTNSRVSWLPIVPPSTSSPSNALHSTIQEDNLWQGWPEQDRVWSCPQDSSATSNTLHRHSDHGAGMQVEEAHNQNQVIKRPPAAHNSVQHHYAYSQQQQQTHFAFSHDEQPMEEELTYSYRPSKRLCQPSSNANSDGLMAVEWSN